MLNWDNVRSTIWRRNESRRKGGRREKNSLGCVSVDGESLRTGDITLFTDKKHPDRIGHRRKTWRDSRSADSGKLSSLPLSDPEW